MSHQPLLQLRNLACGYGEQSVVQHLNLLKLHPQTVYDMARGGELRAFKVGREWRLRRERG